MSPWQAPLAKGKCRFKTKLGQFLADGWIDILFPFLAFLVWLGLILWQPHLSATLILGFVMLAMFLAAGIRCVLGSAPSLKWY